MQEEENPRDNANGNVQEVEVELTLPLSKN